MGRFWRPQAFHCLTVDKAQQDFRRLPCAVGAVRGAICALPQVHASRFALRASRFALRASRYALRATRFALCATRFALCATRFALLPRATRSCQLFKTRRPRATRYPVRTRPLDPKPYDPSIEPMCSCTRCDAPAVALLEGARLSPLRHGSEGSHHAFSFVGMACRASLCIVILVKNLRRLVFFRELRRE